MHNDKQEPVLVRHPETGNFVDVRPFFNLIFCTDQDNGDITDVEDSIETSLRFFSEECSISYQLPNSEFSRQNLYTTFYKFKDMLANTTIINNKTKSNKS